MTGVLANFIETYFSHVVICTSDIFFILSLCRFTWPKEMSSRLFSGSMIALFAVLSSFVQSQATYGPSLRYYSYIVITILILFCVVRIIGRQQAGLSIYYVAVYYIVTDSIIYFYMFYLRNMFGIDYMLFGPVFWTRFLANTLLIAMKAAAVWGLKKVIKEASDLMEKPLRLLMIFVSFFLYLYMRNISFWLKVPDLDMQLSFLPAMLLLSFSILVLLIGNENLLFSQKQQMEIEQLEWMLHHQYEQYQSKKETIDALGRQYHDLKHHLRGLQAISSEQRVLDYIQNMLDAISSGEIVYQSGNEVLDILLTDVILACRDRKIRLIFQVDGAGWDRISPVDISALFGNILDNAIESCAKVTDMDRRVIHWKTGKSDAYLVTSVKNSFSHSLLQKDGKLQTTKEEALHHGYGLDSIRSLVEKYGGEMDIKIEENEFTLRFFIPINKG